ncbi:MULTISPECIES: hypothetical protein [Vibrio]|uniref:Uncharacterized protein n=2 Tax=Vibrio TaxID=662 RepID=A0A510IIE5_9VIBR|nr:MULTISPECIES: hypothetical protein [Vibrio]RTZ20315.1 hypothetical protein EKN09_24535 [Vibrio penaeicida]BBL92236.1 hypothetical protein VroAM7_48890 [Vibrio rotiferianus]GLQ71148.1 hypothetical protein GCM10007932_05080 [Vibrio penaeicida]
MIKQLLLSIACLSAVGCVDVSEYAADSFLQPKPATQSVVEHIKTYNHHHDDALPNGIYGAQYEAFDGTMRVDINVQVKFEDGTAETVSSFKGYNLFPPQTLDFKIEASAQYEVKDGWISYQNVSGHKGLFPAYSTYFNLIDDGRIIKFVVPGEFGGVEPLYFTLLEPIE